jgi:heat-inducible transcriptional repressor
MIIGDLNQRSNEIFKKIVESYVETGEPVGSKTLSQNLSKNLSPATIRNIMSDLEDAGLLYSPHVSSGRLPTDKGMQYFVNGLLEVGDLSKSEQARINSMIQDKNQTIEEVLEKATQAISGLSNCAGIVMAPKTESTLSHIEFVHLGQGRALAVIINQEDVIENRIIQIPDMITPTALIQAGRYLSERAFGKTLTEMIANLKVELSKDKSHLDVLTTQIVEAGIAEWSKTGNEKGSLIVRGQSHLLDSIQQMNELEQVRELFSMLDKKEAMQQLLTATLNADCVQIFIGAENQLFSKAGCSLIVAPYHNKKQKIIGALGIVGPTRMNYSRIIPMLDYTAKLVGKILDS